MKGQITVQKTQNRTYFLFHFFHSPYKIERHELSSDGPKWLSPISLPTDFGRPSTFGADDQHLFVAYRRTVYRYDLDGGNPVHVTNTADPVDWIGTDGDIIFISVEQQSTTTVNRTSNTVIDRFGGLSRVTGSSIARSKNRIVGRTRGRSPSDIYLLAYNDDGTKNNSFESPYHGDYPDAFKTFVFPDEDRVVDSSGTIYSVDDLTYAGKLLAPVKDIEWLGGTIPIVLHLETLIAYNLGLLPTGSAQLIDVLNESMNEPPMAIRLHNDTVIVFSLHENRNSIVVDTVPLNSLSPDEPEEPIDPTGLIYTPDHVFLDKNGILYLFSSIFRSVFRWDPVSQNYLPTIPLVGPALYVAYSVPDHLLYTAYSSGLVRKIDLLPDQLLEDPLLTLSQAPLGLATAGRYIFAVDISGPWVSHYTYDPNGTRIDAVDWNYQSNEYVWNEANQRMYFRKDYVFPAEIVSEEINENGNAYPNQPPGGIGNKMDNWFERDIITIEPPVRIKPDGSILIIGSGILFNATTLKRLDVGLPVTIIDAAFLDDGLRTVRDTDNRTQFQSWLEPTLAHGLVMEVPGTPHRLLRYEDNSMIAVVIADSGIPSFYVLTESFQIVEPATIATPELLEVTSTSSQMIVSWMDVSGETGYTIQRRTGTSEDVWVDVGTTSVSVTEFEDDLVTPGLIYSYRIQAFHTDNSKSSTSEWSTTVTGLFGELPTPRNFEALYSIVL